ncbi:MAG TPA: hypothetical protein VGJ40_04390 [Gaiellaceae bacterium]|jgi:hypothetical protein
MEGYDVITVDEHKVGKVVGEAGDFLIVEQGALFKSKHALPREFAHVDDSEQQVRVTVPKEVVTDSPKLDGELDERTVAEHYGLTLSPGPGAEGYGGTPESAEEERARIHEGGEQSGLQESSPALLGDRLAGVDERRQEER